MKKCTVVAITGRSGSGKSTVSRYFEAEGYPVLDADAVAREVVLPGSECLAQLAEAFGSDVLSPDGTLQRSLLATRAFATPQATARLTAITHPAILRILLHRVEQARAQGAALVFVDGAVIIGAAFEAYCDKFIVVTAPERDAITRIVMRDGISKQAARDRLAAQLPEQSLCAVADYVLDNSTTLQNLLAQAKAVLQQLRAETEQYETSQ